jgi:hypothetical protein
MLSWNNRRLLQLHARLARRDVRCSEYPDHKTRKQYRIFAEHGDKIPYGIGEAASESSPKHAATDG